LNLKCNNVLCSLCHYKFKLPVLSDMAYGEFIASSESGRFHFYFNAIESKEWEFISQIMKIQSSKYDAEVIRFQTVVGYCMDKKNSEYLSIVGSKKCPNCQSIQINYIGDIEEDFIQVDRVSFNEFNKLNREGKEELIISLMKKL